MKQSRYRKRIAPLLTALLALGALAACVSETEEATAVIPLPTPTEQVPTPEDGALEEEDETPTPAVEDADPTSTPTDVPEADGPEEYPVSVTRSDGVELTLEQRPERIVSLSPGATEVLYAIGAGEQLVAADMFSDYPAETQELPKVDAYQPDPEAIVAVDPDLVLVIYDADGIVAVLDDLDVPVLYLEAPHDLQDLFDQIRMLGEVTGNRDAAEDVASSLEQRVQSIVEELEDVDGGPRIYHELDESLYTVSPNSFIGDLYNLLKAQNIADAALGDYPQLSEEAILDTDPEVIIVPAHGVQDGSIAEGVRGRAGWDSIDAVENDRVYEIDGDIVSRPGPRIVDALEQLAEMLYPERFVSQYESVVAGDDFRVAA